MRPKYGTLRSKYTGKIWHAKEQADVSLEKYGTPKSKSAQNMARQGVSP